MKIAVFFTGHEIANKVGLAIREGLITAGHQVGWYSPENMGYVERADICIGYGILRGMDDVFRECDRLGKPWFNIDRGYWKPGHFDGYYRVSLRGTQQTVHLNALTPDYDRWSALGVEMKPWRGNKGDYTLICPPTKKVAAFFGVDAEAWTNWSIKTAESNWPLGNGLSSIRTKDSPTPLADHLMGARVVLTFNSSVGWQALAAGIPCISDPTHSIVGAWFKGVLMDNLSKLQEAEREKLFGVMANLQLTLDEMRQGKTWELMSLLLSTSVTTAESRNAVT